MSKNIFILVMSLLFISGAFAQGTQTLRRCLLLPVTDNMQGAYSFPVFKKVEENLEGSDWCYYRSSSELMTLFEEFRSNLKGHFENPEVIKLVSQKTNAGTIIRIHLEQKTDGITTTLTILGPSGDEVFFSESKVFPTSDYQDIPFSIINWLGNYEKTIPYDALAIGSVGDQVTIDSGKASRVRIGESFVLRRPTTKKAHPLLKEIVEWDSEIIGRGKIFNVSQYQAIGKLEQVIPGKKPQKGDWIRIDREEKGPIGEEKFPELTKEDFSKIGMVRLGLVLGKGTHTARKTNSNQAEGTLVGFDFVADIWATRNWLAIIGIGKSFSTYDKTSGSGNFSRLDANIGRYRFLGGYKFLPLGFFYGPQVDVLLGYKKLTFNYDRHTQLGFGETSISGPVFGARGSLPLSEIIRLGLGFEAAPIAWYSEDKGLNGQDDSSNSYEFNLFSSYEINQSFAIDGRFEIITAKTKFSGGNELSHKQMNFVAGFIYNF